jgi:hypothetical protein
MVLHGWQVFWAGTLGPVLVEIVKVSQMRKGRVARLYRRWQYWLLTLPLLPLGGIAAVIHGTESVSLATALQLGATAPLLIASWASGRSTESSYGLLPAQERTRWWDLARW